LERVKVSVIVPVYNDKKRIISCVDSIFAQRIETFELEVILIDNGSTDGTYELALEKLQPKYKNLTVDRCSITGSYAARNHGLTLAQGEYIAFTDSDCIVSEDWIESNLAEIKGKPVNTILAGEVEFFKEENKTTEQSAIDFESTFSMKQGENAKNGKCITANFFCNKGLFETVGRFNASLKSGGDIEISQRVVASGGKVLFNAEAKVGHPSRNKEELILKRRRIIGGTWDSTLASAGVKESLKFIFRLLKMFLGRTKKVIFDSELSLSRKLSLVYMLLTIFFISISELIALASGKQSNRQ